MPHHRQDGMFIIHMLNLLHLDDMLFAQHLDCIEPLVVYGLYEMHTAK